MYALVSNLLSVPATNANTNITSVAATIVVILTAVVIDLVYKFLRRFTKK